MENEKINEEDQIKKTSRKEIDDLIMGGGSAANRILCRATVFGDLMHCGETHLHQIL